MPYLTIWLDTDNDGSRDDRLWFEPDYTSDAALDIWQTWDALNGQWYNDNGPSGPGSNTISLAAYLADFPNATIVNDAGQGIGGIRIATGFASPGDDFNTYVDGFTIGTIDGTTIYNFELVPLPPALWAGLPLLGVLGVGTHIRAARRRRMA